MCDDTHIDYNDSIINIVRQDTFSNRWRKRAYNMDPLWNAHHETYRILTRHSQTNYSHLYTVENNENGPRIIFQQFVAPEIDKRNNKLDKEIIFELSDKDWITIKKKFEENCFWSESLDREIPKTIDGGTWFVEGYDPTKRNCGKSDYHIDVSFYEEENKLGDIVRLVMSYNDQSEMKDVPQL